LYYVLSSTTCALFFIVRDLFSHTCFYSSTQSSLCNGALIVTSADTGLWILIH
jgi:hypothetical protein